MIYRYPVNYVAITQKFGSKHKGLDLGWSSKHGGKNVPIYAAADGVIYATHDKDRTKKSWGNYIKILHEDGSYTMYAHLLESSLKVKKGDKVVQGQEIGNMGASGEATGNHLHFEIYKGGAGTSNRVDPLPLTYVYPDQEVCESDKDIVKYYNPSPEEEKIKEALVHIEQAEIILKGIL